MPVRRVLSLACACLDYRSRILEDQLGLQVVTVEMLGGMFGARQRPAMDNLVYRINALRGNFMEYDPVEVEGIKAIEAELEALYPWYGDSARLNKVWQEWGGRIPTTRDQ